MIVMDKYCVSKWSGQSYRMSRVIRRKKLERLARVKTTGVKK